MSVTAITNQTHSSTLSFGSPVPEALNAFRRGVPVLLLDDSDRENEADLVVAADTLTLEVMALFIREGSGIVCLCLTPERADRLELPPMVQENESAYQTAFTVAIDARHGITSGVSAADRLTTVRAATSQQAQPSDLVRPGHVYPLRARAGGVLTRRGHTEGSVDLARLAGLSPSAILCELMNPDGTMARGSDVTRFAKRHQFPVLSIADIVSWRTQFPT
jgi:3,4-dihydroxy 2-butanone 4-phosphate synthase